MEFKIIITHHDGRILNKVEATVNFNSLEEYKQWVKEMNTPYYKLHKTNEATFRRSRTK